MINFSKRLADLLADSGRSQVDLAKYLGVKPATVSVWLNGKGFPQFDKLEPIARFFRITVPDLLGDTAPQDIPSPYLIYYQDRTDLAAIPRGSEVRIELQTEPEIGDIVLYKSFEEEQLLRLAAYRDKISVLMSDDPKATPIISRDEDREIVGTATAILLKKAKKEPAPVGVSGADSAENKDNSNNLLYHEKLETSNYEDKKI